MSEQRNLRAQLQAELDELAAIADPSPAQAGRRLWLAIGLSLRIPELVMGATWLIRTIGRIVGRGE
jgi:hypothetical protein